MFFGGVDLASDFFEASRSFVSKAILSRILSSLKSGVIPTPIFLVSDSAASFKDFIASSLVTSTSSTGIASSSTALSLAAFFASSISSSVAVSSCTVCSTLSSLFNSFNLSNTFCSSSASFSIAIFPRSSTDLAESINSPTSEEDASLSPILYFASWCLGSIIPCSSTDSSIDPSIASKFPSDIFFKILPTIAACSGLVFFNSFNLSLASFCILPPVVSPPPINAPITKLDTTNLDASSSVPNLFSSSSKKSPLDSRWIEETSCINSSEVSPSPRPVILDPLFITAATNL